MILPIRVNMAVPGIIIIVRIPESGNRRNRRILTTLRTSGNQAKRSFSTFHPTSESE